MLHLIALSLKQAEAKPDGLRPLNIVVPADHHKTDKWRPNMVAQVPTPKQFPSLKKTLNPNQELYVFPRHIPVFHPSA